jgi:hypothetical protein
VTFKPKTANRVYTNTQPKLGADPEAYYGKRPVWRLGSMHMTEPDDCGWHLLNGDQLNDVHSKLVDFERLTWKEILVRDRHRNHLISVDKLEASARKALQKTPFRDSDQVVSLRLSGAERVFGVMENEIFNVLWWDPDHKVCPAPKRNT